jgi:Sulfotransferase domain
MFDTNLREDRIQRAFGECQAAHETIAVFAVGLSRSGTVSLRDALLQLGYDHTYHGFDAESLVHDLRNWSLLGRRK